MLMTCIFLHHDNLCLCLLPTSINYRTAQDTDYKIEVFIIKITWLFGNEVAPSLPGPLFLELIFQNDIANILETNEKRELKLWTYI